MNSPTQGTSCTWNHTLFFCVWFISLSILFSGHRSLLNSLPNVQIPHETQEAEEYSCAVSSFVKTLCIFTVLCLNWYSQTIGSYFFFFLLFSISFLHGRLNILTAKCVFCQLNLRCSILEIYLSTFPQYCLLVPTSVHLRLYVHLFLPKLMRVAFQKEHVQNRPADIEVWGRLCSSCLCQCRIALFASTAFIAAFLSINLSHCIFYK